MQWMDPSCKFLSFCYAKTIKLTLIYIHNLCDKPIQLCNSTKGSMDCDCSEKERITCFGRLVEIIILFSRTSQCNLRYNRFLLPIN